jgi:hypothetical protein
MLRFKIKIRKDAVLIGNKYILLDEIGEVIGEVLIVGLDKETSRYQYLTLIYEEVDPVPNGIYTISEYSIRRSYTHWVLVEEFNKT